MPKTIIINGSPKPKDSVSGIFIDKIEEFLEKKPKTYHVNQLIDEKNGLNTLHDILNSDVLVFVFPLYVDSLPAPLIKVLTRIEEIGKNTNGNQPKVYAISNCGFFEPGHNRLALDIVKNFSSHLGMSWGYGIGIGGGGLIASQSKNIAKDGSASNVYNVLYEFCKAIENNDKAIENKHDKKENVFLSPEIPRSLYKLGGNLGWYQIAMKNGTLRSLKAQVHDFKK